MPTGRPGKIIPFNPVEAFNILVRARDNKLSSLAGSDGTQSTDYGAKASSW